MAGQRFRTRLATFTSIVAGFLTLLVLTLALAARAEAYVYWTNPGAGTIGRANLDGTGVDKSFITGAGTAGVAVNRTHVYWVSTEPGPAGPISMIGRANLDGTLPTPRLIADTSAGWTTQVAVDDEHIYWISRGVDDSLNPGTGAIARANLDGSGVDENFIAGLSFPAGAVAVDASHVYWTSYSEAIDPFSVLNPAPEPDRIGRANLDGTDIEESFITASASELAVGAAHLWWTTLPYSESEPGDAIWRANLDGTGSESVIGPAADFILCPIGEEGRGAIAVDGTHVYWTEVSFTPQSEAIHRIGRAKLDGSRVNHGFITDIGDGCGDVAVDVLGPHPFGFGSVKKNKRKGTAKLTVNVPGPGNLDLAKTRRVKRAEAEVEASPSREKLPIRPRRKAKKRLNAKGKARVTVKVTYTPKTIQGGKVIAIGDPNTQSKRLKLIKRR